VTVPLRTRLGLLCDPDFARLFAATGLGQAGDRIAFLALPLVAIVQLHADEMQVGLLTATTTVGALLVGLPAGAWVDRMRKRPVMVGTDLARALVLLTVPVGWWAGALEIWWLYAVALVHGVLTVFFDVAYVSYLPQLVGRSRLVEGNAKLSAVRSVTSIGGPAVAGPLVGWLGASVTLLTSSAGMAASGLLATGIRGNEPTSSEHGERPRLRREIREGLRFVVGHAVLRATVAVDAVFSLFLAMYQSMLLVFLDRQVGFGAFGIGLVLSGMGCGALLGALVAVRVAKWAGQGPVIWLAPLVSGPPAAVMPLAGGGWSAGVAAVGLAAVSLGGVVRFVAQSSLQQTLTPDRLLGRMSATARCMAWGGLPLGGVLGGLSGATYGAGVTLWVGAAGMTVSFLPGFLSPLRGMRAVTPGGGASVRPSRACRR
jgi:MFS family permease